MLRHDAAESVRLAYVAATRARDLLVVPVFGDGHALAEPGVGWVDALAPALYPSEATRRSPRKAEGCPEFGDDSVRKRPARVQATSLDSVAPGLHTGFAGGEVVWWDPQVLELGAQPLGGVRQQELLAETPRSQEWLAAHEAWVERSQQTRAQASVPTLIARSVTELAAARTTPDASAIVVAAAERSALTASAVTVSQPARATIAIEHTTAPRALRPRGKRFGSLVHAILALVPFDAEPQLIKDIAAAQARLIAATAAELSAAVTAVSAALSHDLLRRAARALELRREVPIAHVHADGTLVEGIIDLAFREPQGWLVIDFKTDAELRDPARYVEQVRLYVEAVRAATDQPAEGMLLAV
jgi:ATP-dependent exoDNAse (exonuclease V) beta subunit